MQASHFRSVGKAITWRVLATSDTFVLSFFLTGKASVACGIVSFELLTKSVLYYGHERVWEISWLANPLFRQWYWKIKRSPGPMLQRPCLSDR